MAKVVVLVTYDLATPPGLQGRFREEMKSLKWRFDQGGKDLPETTCTAVFAEGVSKESAVITAKTHLGKVSAILVKEDKGFKIKRFLAIAMEEGHFNAALKDIG